MTMILPIKEPPKMLQPPDAKVIGAALSGFKKFGVTEQGLTALADAIAGMPNGDHALNLIEECDHLIWLASIWLHIRTFMVGVEFDVSKPSEPERWEPAPLAGIQWCLLDRYRTAGLEAEAKAWIEQNAVPLLMPPVPQEPLRDQGSGPKSHRASTASRSQ